MAGSKTAKHSADQVREWRRSGVTQAAYCARHGLKASTLAYWCWRARRAKVRAVDTPQATHFVPLQVKDVIAVEKDATPVALELWLPSGVRARIAAGMDPQWVAKMLGAVTC